jgi:carbohydrate-selective porin OprB
MRGSLRHSVWLHVVGGAFVLLFSLVAGAQQTAPANPPSTGPGFNCSHPADPHRRHHACNDALFDTDETLALGWDGVRRTMSRIGVTPTASYVGALQTNVSGAPHQVWSYAGQLSFAANADLNEIAHVRGLSGYVGLSWGTGSNLGDSLDTEISPSGLYAPSFYLGEMYLQEKLLGDKLTLLGGRIAASNGFAALPIFTNYVTYGINPNPFTLGANDGTFLGPPPGSQWGVQGSYELRPSLQVSAGVFNTNLNSANGEDHGADFTLQEGNKGVVTIAEINYFRNQGSNASGMPGQITVGALHSSDSFPQLDNPLRRSDGYSAAYVMAQQMIFRPEGPGSSRGATVWGAWTFHSKDIVSSVPMLWGAGVNYQGLVPARKRDNMAA